MASLLALGGEREKRYVHLTFNFNLKLILLQSVSSGDEDMVCVSECLDMKYGLESGWGGPGEVKALLDDGVPPGPGEEEEERQTDKYIRRRILMLEETIVRRGKEGWDRSDKERHGRGGW